MDASTFRPVAALVLALLIGLPTPAVAQSVWPESGASPMIRKSKVRAAIEKEDIIMVLVLENDSASNDASLDSQRQMEVDMLIDSFIRFSGHHLKPDFSPQPEVEFEGGKRVNGRGSTDRREILRIRIAAKVVEVLPNGNLVIEAYKERTLNDERTRVTLTGEVRSEDVASDYSVVSERVFGMKLSYTGKGPVSANVAWTWLTWLIDLIWPF